MLVLDLGQLHVSSEKHATSAPGKVSFCMLIGLVVLSDFLSRGRYFFPFNNIIKLFITLLQTPTLMGGSVL
jgi:hypothetical protein